MPEGSRRERWLATVSRLTVPTYVGCGRPPSEQSVCPAGKPQEYCQPRRAGFIFQVHHGCYLEKRLRQASSLGEAYVRDWFPGHLADAQWQLRLGAAKTWLPPSSQTPSTCCCPWYLNAAPCCGLSVGRLIPRWRPQCQPLDPALVAELRWD